MQPALLSGVPSAQLLAPAPQFCTSQAQLQPHTKRFRPVILPVQDLLRLRNQPSCQTLRLARRLKGICTVPRLRCGGDRSGSRVAPLDFTLGIPGGRSWPVLSFILPRRTTVTGLQGEWALPARSTQPFISRALQTELGACPQAPTALRWLISTRDRLGRAAAGQMRKRRPRTWRCGAVAGGARWTSPRWL